MYLAGFDTPDGPVAQGLVSLALLPAVGEELEARWWDTLSVALDGLDGVGYAGVSARALLTPGIELRRALVVTVSADRASRLRHWLATVTRLETLIPGTARLPITRDEYDAEMEELPDQRCRVAASGFRVGDTCIACDFRLAPSLGSLMEEADSHGYRLGYSVAVRPLAVAAEQARRALSNARAVHRLGGVPPALAEMQSELAQRVLRASAVCQELVAVDRGEPADWLLDALRRHFLRAFGTLPFEPPAWELVDMGFDNDLACPMFSDSPAMLEDDLCAAVLAGREKTDVLLWRPPPALAASFARPHVPEPDIERELASAVPGLPAADLEDGPFFFVSYRRADLTLVLPIIESVRRQGWRLWYDAEIAGGSEWNAVIEQRLATCSAVLLFLSQPAVDSKFVRRELQYADGLQKPIICVRLEPAELRYGLGMLLKQYQFLDHDAPDFSIRVDAALTRVAAIRSA